MSFAELHPLGVLSIMDFASDPDRVARALRPNVGGLDHEEARQVAAYMRSGALVLAIMEQTDDVLGSRFSVAGGSGIQTDGRFFCRVDAADYVEHHDLALPAEFTDIGRSIDWRASGLTRDQLHRADVAISDFYRASLDAALWPDHE